MGILNNKFYNEESIFKPDNLLREARRQKEMPECSVPAICLLDPDGDILDYLIRHKKATVSKCWACYHTKLYTFELNGHEIGIVGCVVGASFAVLIAEQLFVSGCEWLVSITSSGIIKKISESVSYLLIREAVRDEGTSYHYIPASATSTINKDLLRILERDLVNKSPQIAIGKSWTTDAPYRETQSAIDAMKQADVNAVEMEAAALYAFAKAKNKKVICFAHITNSMAQNEMDFEKGIENGSITSLELVASTIKVITVPAGNSIPVKIE
jgi:uridine phosphorylase